MANRTHHYRQHRTQILLSEEEHLALRAICRDLGVAARDILMMGLQALSPVNLR